MLMVDERMDSTVGKGLLRVRLCSHMSLLQVLHTPCIHVCMFVCTQHALHYMYTHTYIFIVTHVHMSTKHIQQPLHKYTIPPSPSTPPTHTYIHTQGSADPLNSAFHLTYNMVLNLLRVEEINPEYMLERSFYQFQNNSAIPSLEQSTPIHIAIPLYLHFRAFLSMVFGSLWISRK